MADNELSAQRLAQLFEVTVREAQRMIDALDTANQTQEQMIASAQKRVTALQNENAQLDRAVQTRQALQSVEMSIEGRLRNQAESVEMQQTVQANLVKMKQQEIVLANQLGEDTTELLQQYDRLLEQQKEINAQLNAQAYITENLVDAQKDISNAALEFAGITSDMNLTEKFLGFVGEAGDLRSAFDALAQSMGNAASKAMIVNATSRKLSEGILAIGAEMIRQALSLDSVEAQTRRTMGVNREYASSIREVYHANKMNGITSDMAAESFGALHGQMSQFSQLNAAQRTEITETAAQLSQLGVSNQAFADGMDMSTRALRMTADEARRTQTDLARFAGDLGIAPEVMARGFADAGPVLAKFGDNATVAFKNVAKTAKETGIEIDRILDYTQQFDTFEGAAERVGSLNAMLGGDFINAMDLMATEDPAERMRMITDAVHSAGKSFEELGYYEKLALAEAGGFADVSELSRAMSGDFTDNATATAENAMSQEELAEINRQNLDLMQKMQAMMAGLAPSIMKVVDALNMMMMPIMAFIEKFGSFVLPALILWRAWMIKVQIQHMSNVRAIAAHEAAKIRSTAATNAGIVASTRAWVADKAETAGIYALIAADKARTVATNIGTKARMAYDAVRQKGILISIKERALAMAEIAWKGVLKVADIAGAVAKGVYSAAKGLYTLVTGLATAATTAFGVSLTVATGGLILLIPLIIGIVAGLYKMYQSGGTARTIVIALGAALVFLMGPIFWVIAAVILMIKYWDQVKAAMWSVWEGIKTVGKWIFFALTWPFQMAWKAIKAVFGFFMGDSPSPFGLSMVEGIKSVGQMIINFLTWPYRMAWNIITGIWALLVEKLTAPARIIKEKVIGAWTAVKDFVVQNWDTIKSIILGALVIIGRALLFTFTFGMSEVVIAIAQNWETIKSWFTSFFSWVEQKFIGLKRIGLILKKAILFPFNVVIKAINKMLSGLERMFTITIRVPRILPGPSRYKIGPPNLGRIPELARGTDNHQGGAAVVGEQGPELVNMPQGTSVSPAEKTKNFAEKLEMVATTTKKIAGALAIAGVPGAGAVAAAAGAAGGRRQQGGSGQPTTINITLELDKRVLARHIEEVMVENLNPASG